jgi:hypothetical protein
MWLSESNKGRHAGLQSLKGGILAVSPGSVHGDAVQPVRLVVKVALQHLL